MVARRSRCCVAAPLSLTSFWLQTGLFAMAAAIGAIGLTLLVGVTGQLSLGHAFFVAVGAFGYAFLAGSGDSKVGGLGLPAPLAAVGAVALAGAAGALFSPIAGRLRGIYLGLASLGLVFLGQHILHNATAVTGGFNGRDVAPFELFGFSFTATNPELVAVPRSVRGAGAAVVPRPGIGRAGLLVRAEPAVGSTGPGPGRRSRQ